MMGRFTRPAAVAAASMCLLLGMSSAFANEESKSPKQLVTEFFYMAFVEGKVAEAAMKYVSEEKYIQHSPLGQDGREFLINELAPMLAAMQNKSVIKKVIAEDDLVVVFSHSLMESDPDNPGLALMDIFRVENEKIVEHWDVMQPVPKPGESRNPNSMF